MKHGAQSVFSRLRDLIPGRTKAIREALAQGPWVNVGEDGSTLLEWFLPEGRLCVWIEGPIPPESSWSYADLSGRIRSGELTPRIGSRK